MIRTTILPHHCRLVSFGYNQHFGSTFPTWPVIVTVIASVIVIVTETSILLEIGTVGSVETQKIGRKQDFP